MNGSPNIHVRLIDALRADLAAREEEVRRLRDSARYRAGGWLLAAWPPGRETLKLVPRLLRLFWGKSRRAVKKPSIRKMLGTGDTFDAASVLVLGACEGGLPSLKAKAWQTDDVVSMARRLDAAKTPGTLILCRQDPEILRRLARLRMMGWQVFWHSACKKDEDDPALRAYLRAHALEYREPGSR